MNSGSFEGDFKRLNLPKGVIDKIYRKNADDVLDEMSINDISHYAISDPESGEKDRMQQLQEQENLPNAL